MRRQTRHSFKATSTTATIHTGDAQPSALIASSPWTNQYFPPIDNGFYPSPHVRSLEETANFLFSKYREMFGASVGREA